MNIEIKKKNKKIGLALSGGGQRAAAFHLGVLRKLHELKILDKIKILSTISGGSIIGAYYCLYQDNFDVFYNNFLETLKLKFRNESCSNFCLENIDYSINHFSSYLFDACSHIPDVVFFAYISNYCNYFFIQSIFNR